MSSTSKCRDFFSCLCVVFCIALAGCSAGSGGSDYTWLGKANFVVSGTGTSPSVNVAWNPTNNYSLYAVYRSTTSEGPYIYLGTSGANTFTDNSATPGQVYFYRVGAGDFRTPPPYDTADGGSATRGVTDNCFTENPIRQLKSFQSETDMANYVTQLYAQCSQDLSNRFALKSIQPALNNSELQMIFSMIMAHLMSPYGNESATTLTELLAEDTMACANYIALAGDIYQLLAGDNYPESIYFAGFINGVVGNHAQLVFVSSLRQILLDPTTGIVAIINFSDLVAGTPTNQVFSLYGYWNDSEEPDYIPGFHWTVYSAILNGLYKPSDVMYFSPRVQDVDAYIDMGQIVRYPTPVPTPSPSPSP